MNAPLPTLYLIRHGETEWAKNGRHTGLTDLPLTDRGRSDAAKLAPVLQEVPFVRILCSPLARAKETAALAGFADRTELCGDLREWSYGDYEGLTTAQIRLQAPAWTVWTGTCPHGETIAEIGARADAVLAGLTDVAGPVALFSHGHFLRALTARWLGLATDNGRHFKLDTTTISTLGFEHDTPVILTWNRPVAPV